MKLEVTYYFLILLIQLVTSFEIDDPPISSTLSSFYFDTDQTGRSINQTDDILSTIYSTVANAVNELSTKPTFNSTFNDDILPLDILTGREEALKDCQGTRGDYEFTIRPLGRICDYFVTKNNSGICSLELTLLGWEGECRESWLEAGGKLECGSLSGTRSVNFDRNGVSLKMRSKGILRVKQIPCSTQMTPPTVLVGKPQPTNQKYPDPYIPPNLRPTTTLTNTNTPNFPIGPYLPNVSSDGNIFDNEIPQNKIDMYPTYQDPNTKFPVIPNGYRPSVQPPYPGMKYGPPECDSSTGVVIYSPGYPNVSPPSECTLVLSPNARLCNPNIYFNYFEVGNKYGSSCQNSKLDIGSVPFCGCLSNTCWQVPNHVFNQEGLVLRFRGQGRFLITVYYNTCQPGFGPNPPDQRQPWRCRQYPAPFPPPIPQPQPPRPIQPPVLPPIQPPNPYPITPRPPYPYPQPRPPYPPRPYPEPTYPPRPTYPEPPYPYPPKQPPPQPPFTYPPAPKPQPPIIYPPTTVPPRPFPPPRPVPPPGPTSYPEPLPGPYPPSCIIINIPQGSLNCAPIQPQFYCYRFEPPKGYCQMAINLNQISMSSDDNCHREYMTTGIRNPRICRRDMENIPMYIDRGGYLQGMLMGGSSVKASFQGLPCSCNEQYRQTDFTLRGTPTQDQCLYTIHRANQGICSLELTLENLDLLCGTESLLIDGKSFCGFRANEKLELPFMQDKVVIQYRRTSERPRPGSFTIKVVQSSRCIQSALTATGRDVKYYEDCILPLTGVYGNINFPAASGLNAYLSCSYIFQPKEGYCYVKLDFDEVDIPNSLDCYQYYLDINGIKYCSNTLTSSTKVLRLDDARGSSVSYKADRSSQWSFTYSLLPCKLEILSKSRNNYPNQYYKRDSTP